MRAVILAAGRGSRMGAHTDEHPKCLVNVGGRTLLDRHRDALDAAGVEEVGIVTGYCAETLTGRLSRDFHAPRWQETNMVVSLTAADDWLSTAPCLVAYGDIFYTADTVRSLVQASAELAIAYDPHWLELWAKRFADPLDDAETFRLRSDSTVAEIGRRAASTEEIQGQYMGLLRFTPPAWTRARDHLAALTPATRDALDMTSLLQNLITTGEQILAIPRHGPWGEVDHPADISLYTSILEHPSTSESKAGIA
ncbi:phosphocholine cytidylyltransferase family protein [Nocardia sp. NPDC052278]|uniref:phosphocholine cytidylyltransferase family protein n=1 Tax=unclassified Nocardia TaxID=2637762 RepID=UPI0036CAC8C8